MTLSDTWTLPATWKQDIELLIAEGLAAIDHRRPDDILALVADDFVLSTFSLEAMMGPEIDKAHFAQAMQMRAAAPFDSRHLFSNVRLIEAVDRTVEIGYVLAVHRLEEDATETQVYVCDVVDRWRFDGAGWLATRRILTLALAR